MIPAEFRLQVNVTNLKSWIDSCVTDEQLNVMERAVEVFIEKQFPELRTDGIIWALCRQIALRRQGLKATAETPTLFLLLESQNP